MGRGDEEEEVELICFLNVYDAALQPETTVSKINLFRNRFGRQLKAPSIVLITMSYNTNGYNEHEPIILFIVDHPGCLT
jgi:hypothetical protein